MNAIEIKNLTKVYGKNRGIQDINISVNNSSPFFIATDDIRYLETGNIEGFGWRVDDDTIIM